MSQYDRRPRKRRYDYDDPRYYEQQKRQYRRSFEDGSEGEVRDRLRQLLVRIGEKSNSSLQFNLDRLSKALLVDIAQHGQFILDILFRCVTSLSVKVPIYATLVGLVNAIQQEFGANLVEKLSYEFNQATSKEYFQAAEDHMSVFHRLRLLTRFLGCLFNAHVVTGSDVLKILDQFASQLGHDQLSLNLKEHVALVIISSLCWCGGKIQESNPDELSAVMKKVEVFMDARGRREMNRAFRVLKEQDNDYLLDYWQSVQKISSFVENAWTVNSITAPETRFTRLSSAQLHPMEISPITGWEEIQFDLLPVSVVFNISRLFEEENSDEKDEKVDLQSGPVNKGVNLIERCIVAEYIHDIFEFFAGDAALCAQQLTNVPSSFDANYLCVEALFSHMMRLPGSRKHPLFYGRAVIELFLKDRDLWPRIVCGAVLRLFHMIDTLDYECIDRLCEWLPYHLSNFKFQWPWQPWSFVVHFPIESPKRVFVSTVMQKALHLSFYQSFVKTIPIEMKSLCPHEIQPNWRYALQSVRQKGIMSSVQQPAQDMDMDVDIDIDIPDAATTGRSNRTPQTTDKLPKVFPHNEHGAQGRSMNEIASELVRHLNHHVSVDDVTNYLDTHVVSFPEEKVHPGRSELDEEYLKLSGEYRLRYCQLHVLSLCLFNSGKGTIGATVTLFYTLYANLVRSLIVTPICEILLLQNLREFWVHSPLRIEELAAKLHSKNFISPQSIVRWVFLRENCNLVHHGVVWRIIETAFTRATKTRASYKRGMNSLADRMKQLEKSEENDDVDMDVQGNQKAQLERKLGELTKRFEESSQTMEETFDLLYEKFCQLIKKFKSDIEGVEKDGKTSGEMEVDEDEKKSELKSLQYLYLAVLGRMTQFTRKFCDEIVGKKDELRQKYFCDEVGCDERVQSAFVDVFEGF